jgi:heme exporter protein C
MAGVIDEPPLRSIPGAQPRPARNAKSQNLAADFAALPRGPALATSEVMWSLANPTRFMALSGRLLPWLAGASALVLAAGLYAGWFLAPADYQQGETVRIMFLHVPAAWLALFFYLLMAISALGTLIWRHPLADVSQKAAAPIGAAFTFVCLVTGALWGKPMWGTYWVWDARLTSMLVLFLMYCGILALWRTIEEPNRAARAVSILTLIGVVNLPVIKFSVDWWYTLHQGPSVLRLGGPTIHPSILYPLLVMAAAFTLLGLTLHLTGMRTEVLRRRVRTLAILEAERLDRQAA